LCASFSLLALVFYMRGRWWAMIAAYVAALLSKPMAVSLPVVMMAIDLYRGRRGAKIVMEKWLLFVLAAGIAGLAFYGQIASRALRTHELGAVERLLVAARSLVFYLWKIVWPAWLSPFYPLGENLRLAQAEFIVPVILCALIAMVGWRVPALRAAGLAYVALVLPVSGLFQTGGQAVADRFAYLAMVPHYPQSRVAYRLITHGLVEQRRFEEAIPYAWHAAAVANDDTERRLLGGDFVMIVQGFIEQQRLTEALPVAQRAVELLPDN